METLKGSVKKPLSDKDRGKLELLEHLIELSFRERNYLWHALFCEIRANVLELPRPLTPENDDSAHGEEHH